jgi:predicted nuclease of predicted toxin-antitoxin system
LIAFYFDVQMPRVVALALRDKGIDVITAQDEQAERWPDAQIMDRAIALKRVLVTCDRDFLIEARKRSTFATVAFVKQYHMQLGRIIANLELMAVALNPGEETNKIFHLPY